MTARKIQTNRSFAIKGHLNPEKAIQDHTNWQKKNIPFVTFFVPFGTNIVRKHFLFDLENFLLMFPRQEEHEHQSFF